MSILDQLQKDLVAAMKAKEEARLSAIRMIKTALQKAHADTGKPLDDVTEQQILKSLVKQRIDAADMFRKGGREEMAVKEEGEKAIIESYLPAAAGEDEMQAAIDAAIAETGATSAKQMGLVMKAVQTKLAGKTLRRQMDQRESEGKTRMTPTPNPREHKPFVPPGMEMKEFTLRAVLLGLVMCVVLGAANAYLGLRAGQTIAATYPAAVIGMAVLRIFKGSILEENIARTAGSIGESVAAGAVFTIPAFIISRSWLDFSPGTAYWKSTSLMLVGSVLGVLFVSLVRRALVEDPELPFPESVAASQIHKAGQLGSQAAKYLFYNMAFGSAVFLTGAVSLFATDKDWLFPVGQIGKSSVRLGPQGTTNALQTGGVTMFSGPTISPAYIGVGYVIGPMLASLNFSGTVIAWGLLIPLLMYFMGPQLRAFLPATATTIRGSPWRTRSGDISCGRSPWVECCLARLYALPHAQVAGVGLSRAFAELQPAAAPIETTARTERYMSSRVVLLGIFGVFCVDDRALPLSLRRHCAGFCGCDRDADCRLLFRDGLGISGRCDWIVE